MEYKKETCFIIKFTDSELRMLKRIIKQYEDFKNKTVSLKLRKNVILTFDEKYEIDKILQWKRNVMEINNPRFEKFKYDFKFMGR